MSVATSTLGRDVKIIALVSVAHGYSHFFQMILPPIFVVLKTEFDVSFTALGLLMTAMYGASGAGQMIAGFLVDRFGARRILLAGLTICSSATVALAMAQSYQALIVLAIAIGIGLAVFHPADLSILTRKVNSRRLGRAYAMHALCGNLGWAAAPPFVVGLVALYDWRTAVAAAGVVGLAYTAFMFIWSDDLRSEPAEETHHEVTHSEAPQTDFQLLLSAPILLCFCYFTFFAMATIGIQSFGALSLMKLHDLTFGTATTALTAFLIASAVGVFVGGIIADRTSRHHLLAMTGTTLASVFMFGVVAVTNSTFAVLALMVLAGFFLGTTTPSRDLIVRKATPSGKAGRVFGFVYSGLDLGSLTMPVLLGWLLDRGDPKLVMLTIAILLLVTVPTVLQVRRRTSAAAVRAR